MLRTICDFWFGASKPESRSTRTVLMFAWSTVIPQCTLQLNRQDVACEAQAQTTKGTKATTQATGSGWTGFMGRLKVTSMSHLLKNACVTWNLCNLPSTVDGFVSCRIAPQLSFQATMCADLTACNNATFRYDGFIWQLPTVGRMKCCPRTELSAFRFLFNVI
jgi:hypothetical protein